MVLKIIQIMNQEETKSEISKVPLNILFDPEGVKKKDIWEIDLMQILTMLASVLEKADKKDLRKLKTYLHFKRLQWRINQLDKDQILISRCWIFLLDMNQLIQFL